MLAVRNVDRLPGGGGRDGADGARAMGREPGCGGRLCRAPPGGDTRSRGGGGTIGADLWNVYQSQGLEEGNPRLSLLPNGRTGNLFLGRPILPRALQVSVGYKF